MLLKYCGNDDRCFPSQITLGKKLGFDPRYVRKLLLELKTAGIIVSKRLGYNQSNTYEVSKSLQIDRNNNSYHLGSLIPLNAGTIVPTKSTYIKGKGKRSVKGLEQLREYMYLKQIKK